MSDQTQAERDADKAGMHAAACVLAQDIPGARDRWPQIFADYAADLLNDIGADADRLYAAARVACVRGADDVASPVRWRQALCAVQLCQQAAHLVRPPALPGH